MVDQQDMFALSPQQELALAKSLHDGMELSPAAQALYEAEGAARFARFHPRIAPIHSLEGNQP